MKPLYLLIAFAILLAACKKDSGGPPKKTNNNKITATVTVLERAPRNFVATGADSTYCTRFNDTARHEIMYTIGGGDGIGGLTLYLFKVLAPGTYEFIEGEPGTNFNFLNYIESDGYDVKLIASTVGTDSLGNQFSNGSFTIIKMAETEVEGTLNAELRDSERLLVKIESMYFRGTFEND